MKKVVFIQVAKLPPKQLSSLSLTRHVHSSPKKKDPSSMKSVDEIVRPLFEPRGIKWEYNVYIFPGDNWRIDGMVPPIHKPEVWTQWVEENRAVEY